MWCLTLLILVSHLSKLGNALYGLVGASLLFYVLGAYLDRRSLGFSHRLILKKSSDLFHCASWPLSIFVYV